jgi:hypothetical protein
MAVGRPAAEVVQSVIRPENSKHRASIEQSAKIVDEMRPDRPELYPWVRDADVEANEQAMAIDVVRIWTAVESANGDGEMVTNDSDGSNEAVAVSEIDVDEVVDDANGFRRRLVVRFVAVEMRFSVASFQSVRHPLSTSENYRVLLFRSPHVEC